jgi:hypothetical protein
MKNQIHKQLTFVLFFAITVGAAVDDSKAAKRKRDRPERTPSAAATKKGGSDTSLPPRTPNTASATPVSIPAGAQEVSPNTFRHTDSSGKTWMYYKTPFGITRSEEKKAEATQKREADAQGRTWVASPTPFGVSKGEEKAMQEATREAVRSAAASGAEAPDTKVVDDGEFVRFERRTPFGVSTWRRRKSELTETEREIVERSKKPAQER